MNSRTLLTLIVALVLSVFSSCAVAQEEEYLKDLQTGVTQQDESAPKSTQGGFFSNLDGSIRVIRNATKKGLSQAMLSKGVEIARDLVDPALKLVGALTLLCLVYEFTMFMAGKNPSVTQVVFDVAIPSMFAVMLIKNYEAKVPDMERLFDFFRNVAAPEGGGGGIDQIFDVYKQAILSVSDAFQNIFQNHGGIMQVMAKPGELVAALIDALACVGLLLVILFLIATGSADIFGLILLGPFMHAIGIAFGPLMIAGLATPWTHDFFKKWLIFLIVSAALTGVLNVIFAIASKMVGPGALDMGQIATDHSSAVGLLITTIMLLTVNSMIEQAPGITSALFPGNLGGARSAGKALKAAISGPAKGVKGTAKSAYKMYKGGKGKVEGGKSGSATAAGTP